MTMKMYFLRVESNTLWEESKQIDKFLKDKNEFSQCSRALNMNTCIMHWNDCQKDMKALSKEFPECLFILDIAGFKPYDIERVYFENGRTQKAHVDIEYSEPNYIDWEE